MIIDKFSGEYRWLSNFHLCSVIFENIRYPSSENAYQAAKTNNKLIRRRFTHCSPSESKRLGREVKLRTDWEDIKLNVMKRILIVKFNLHVDLKRSLIATGESELIEGNWWHDNFWGDCTCYRCENIDGENNLGKLLMKIRDELK